MDNEKIIREFIAAWSRLDAKELSAYFSDDGVYHNMPSGPVSGRANVEKMIAGFIAPWTETEWDILHLVSAGDVVIAERLDREAMSNVSIRIDRTEKLDTFAVSGRGELQLAVLIETLRREGFEFAVSRPEIIVKTIDGQTCEPVEEVVIDVPETAAGSVMEKLAQRKGRMDTMEHKGDRVHMRFIVPSRGLFGYRGEFLTDTRGEGILYRTVEGFEPYAGDLPGRGVGPVVSTDMGRSTPHSIFKIQERAMLFVPPGVDIYEGQIVGESRRQGDLNVNLTRAKKLDNMRASGRDENVIITPHRKFSIEEALGWIEDDELLEVTPQNLRLRKRTLAKSLRKR